MAGCFPGGSCDAFFEPTRSQRDSFTEKLDNVLNNTAGRNYFKKFLHDKKCRDGARAVGLWEKCNALATSYGPEITESAARRRFFDDVDEIIRDAEDVEDVDFATLERLATARENQDVRGVGAAMHALRDLLANCLRQEYNKFRQHLLEHR